MWCILGVCVPVMEEKQEELCELTKIVNGLASSTPALESRQPEKNISNLYKLLDDKVSILDSILYTRVGGKTVELNTHMKHVLII